MRKLKTFSDAELEARLARIKARTDDAPCTCGTEESSPQCQLSMLTREAADVYAEMKHRREATA